MSGTAAGPPAPGPSSGTSALSGIGGSLEDKDCELLCPVCFELINEAYVTRCGHSFCFACVSKSVELHRRCPKCGAVLPTNDHIFPNFLLNELVASRRLRTMHPAAPAVGNEGTALRSLLANEARHLPLRDVDCMLEQLTRRKRLLEAECAASHHRLLLHFLSQLHTRRTQQLQNLQRETQLVKKDMEHVASVLKGLRGGADAVDEGAGGDTLTSLRSEIAELSAVEGMNDEGESEEGFAGGAGGDALAARWRRLSQHFDDFVQCYFTHRGDELYFPGSSPPEPSSQPPADSLATASSVDTDHVPQAPDSRPHTAQGSERPISRGDDDTEVRSAHVHTRGLDAFREDLVAFTRYKALRPLATLSYCSDAINYSTIVSTIEFDKDEELFAIAGVTKRIKVFEWESVVRDAVDVHYPCAEMQCSHKISCVSWNAYHKQVLASSDYEGTVSVWDAGTGQRTRALMEHDKRCWSVHFNRADVRLLASGSDDARVKLWSLNAERSVATLEAKFNVCCVRFNPRSSCHLAFGSADHCVHYYDLRAPRRPLQVLRDHRKAVSYVKFLDSQTIVSASTDSQLKLWRVDSPRCVRSFTGHANEKNFVGLATDGTYVACGSENNSLYVYYAGLSRPLLHYRFDAHRPFLPTAGTGPGGIPGTERRDDEPSEFVSAVCWRRSPHAPALLAANSQGTIKVLELV